MTLQHSLQALLRVRVLSLDYKLSSSKRSPPPYWEGDVLNLLPRAEKVSSLSSFLLNSTLGAKLNSRAEFHNSLLWLYNRWLYIKIERVLAISIPSFWSKASKSPHTTRRNMSRNTILTRVCKSNQTAWNLLSTAVLVDRMKFNNFKTKYRGSTAWFETCPYI